MQKKILLLSASLALFLGAPHHQAQANFFTNLAHSVEDGVKKVVDKLSGTAKKVYEKAKKVGDKFVVEAKHVKDFVKENSKKYGPKAFDALVSGAKKASKGGVEAAKFLKDNRALIEPALLKAIEAGGGPAKSIVRIAVSEIPGAGPLIANSVVDIAMGTALNTVKGLIEADLEKQSGEKTEITGYVS